MIKWIYFFAQECVRGFRWLRRNFRIDRVWTRMCEWTINYSLARVKHSNECEWEKEGIDMFVGVFLFLFPSITHRSKAKCAHSLRSSEKPKQDEVNRKSKYKARMIVGSKPVNYKSLSTYLSKFKELEFFRERVNEQHKDMTGNSSISR